MNEFNSLNDEARFCELLEMNNVFWYFICDKNKTKFFFEGHTVNSCQALID